MSFREANQVQYNAGLEETNNTQFDLDTNPIRNSERARAGSFSAKTNTAQPMALWKSLPVTKGDKVNINVWANYTQPSTSINNVFNFAPFFFNLGQNAGSFLEGNRPVRLEAGFNVLGFFVPNTNTSTNLPKSYLIYRFYDKNDVLLRTEFRLISNIANGNWENLQLPTFEANTNGKLEVFVFNESNINVWFDDIQIQHIPTLISQENHYYAFGVNAKEIEKEGSNRFQYNSKEKESFQGLEWNDYGQRMYDSELGKFHKVDRFAEKYFDFTPYQYGGNNPMKYIDVNGDSLSYSFSHHHNLEAFEIFAKSKAGFAFLSRYAAKGQTLFGNTFSEDGEFHKKNMDLKYSDSEQDKEQGGITTVSVKNGRLKMEVSQLV